MISTNMDTMPTWLQIGSALLIAGLLVFLWPQMKHWMKNSPKAQSGDWSSLILPLTGLVLFVIFLIALVR